MLVADRLCRLTAACTVTLGLLAGCAPTATRQTLPVSASPRLPDAAPEPTAEVWRESPAPEGDWRPHVLARCRRADDAPPAVEHALGFAWDLYRNKRAGSDAIMELEICLRAHPREGLLLVTLGQMYLLGARGERALVPREGPAAATRQWPRTRERLLARAESLLREARTVRPDDGSVEYLLSDLSATRGDTAAAALSLAEGTRKCLLPRSLEILRRYQGLQGRSARLVSRVAPDYPVEAGRAGLSIDGGGSAGGVRAGQAKCARCVSPRQGQRVRPLTSPWGNHWSGRRDLNPRPLGPKPSALPGCATPR